MSRGPVTRFSFSTVAQGPQGPPGAPGDPAPKLVTDLANFAPVLTRQVLQIDGYSISGDGGGGTFIWNATDTRADDRGTIIAVTGIATGRWNRVFSGAIDCRWFGTVGDNIADDSTSLNLCIATAATLGTGVFLYPPKVAYRIALADLSLPAKTVLVGAGKSSTINLVGGKKVALTDLAQHFVLANFEIQSSDTSSTVALHMQSNYFVSVTKVWITAHGAGVFTTAGIQLEGVAADNNNAQCNFWDIDVEGCAGDGVQIYDELGAAGINFYGGNIADCGGYGLNQKIRGPTNGLSAFYCFGTLLESNVLGNVNAELCMSSGLIGCHLENQIGGTASLVTLGAAATTIASGSNGANLPQATINVAATGGTPAFPAAGTIFVTTSSGVQTVQYTGVSGTTFTGCTGGVGTMSTGGTVTRGGGFNTFALRDCDMGGGSANYFVHVAGTGNNFGLALEGGTFSYASCLSILRIDPGATLYGLAVRAVGDMDILLDIPATVHGIDISLYDDNTVVARAASSASFDMTDAVNVSVNQGPLGLTPMSAFFGCTTITITGTDKTAKTMTVPLNSGWVRTIANKTPSQITVAGATGATVPVGPNKTAIVRCDGTNIIRVQDDSPSWAPTDISGCVLWLDSSLGITTPSGVTKWADQSGNAGDVTPNTSTPAYGTASLNGYAGVIGNGTTDALIGTATYSTAALTVFVVAVETSFAASHVVFSMQTSGHNVNIGRLTNTTNYIMADDAGSNPGVVAGTNGAPHIYRGVMNGASSVFALDGTAGSAGTIATHTEHVEVLGNPGGSATYFPGSLYTVIIYNRVLSAGEITTVEANLGAKYGITVA